MLALALRRPVLGRCGGAFGGVEGADAVECSREELAALTLRVPIVIG